MLILIGLVFLVWFGVFAFLWEWTLYNVESKWGALIPFGWLILAPLTLAQFCIWFGGK
jgi:hypothetical protein